MAYCTGEDIRKRRPEIDLVKLTDDRGFGEVDNDVLGAAITDASAVIDAHLRGRLDVPIEPPPPLLTRLCVDISLHFLHQRRGLDSYAIQYADARKLLNEIRAGHLVIGSTTDADSPFFVTNKTKADRLFNRDMLDRM